MRASRPRLRRRRRRTPEELVLAAAITAFAAGFAALSMLRHRSFETGRFDLGNMVQAVWATAHGNPLRVTDVRGEQITRLAAHVDPVLVFFAPLWRVWPSPTMLLAVQALVVALGALPVFWLARTHLGSERAALALALAYLAYPPVQWLTLNEFHPVALACPLLLFAFHALDHDRLGRFALFAALAALTREEIALVGAGFGVWYALARRERLAGSVIAALGVGVAFAAIELVVPYFNEGEGSRFYSRYDEVGGSPGGIAETALRDPGKLLGAAFEGRDLRYLAALVLPLAGLSVVAPLVLVAAAPELALNLLSATTTQTSVEFHYTAGLIPPLFVAAVLGGARVVRLGAARAGVVAGVALGSSVVGNFVLGPLPVWNALPGGHGIPAETLVVSEHDRVAARAVRLIPDDAVVSVTNSLGAHLSARRRILSFPLLRDARWVAVDETKLSYLDSFKRAPAARHLARLRRDARWRLVFAADGVLVFRWRAA